MKPEVSPLRVAFRRNLPQFWPMPQARYQCRRRRVALCIEQDVTYGRQVVQGVLAWMRKRRHWRIEMRRALPYLPWKEVARWDGDGIIAPVYDAAQAKLLARKGVPVVSITDSRIAPGIPTVTWDNRAIGRLVAEHLLQRGLEHFAFFGVTGWKVSAQRLEGFAAALREKGRSCSVCAVGGQGNRLRSYQMVAGGLHVASLRQLPRPVGVFAMNDRLGFGVLEACQILGLAVPDQVAVVGVDNDETLCTLAQPQMSSVAIPAEQVGYRAAEALDLLMEGKRPPQERVLLPPGPVELRHSSDVLAIGDEMVAEALRFIRNHASEFIDVSDVMRVLPVSRRSLERRFRLLVGHGVYQEIRRVHVERAMRLLADTDWPITRVARESGFHSINRFEAGFRRVAGLPASRYRARVRGAGARKSHGGAEWLKGRSAGVNSTAD